MNVGGGAMKRVSRFWVLTVVLGLTGCASSDLLRCDEDYCGPEPGSAEWWDAKASLPVGARQKYKKGKLWPPFARPTGEPQQFSHKYHAAHYWPHPYVCQDREYVRTMEEEQAAAGWMSATTLYEYHFDNETHELNDPGQRQLMWILHTIPDKRRMAFVQASHKREISEARLASVRAAAMEISGSESLPPIMLRMADSPSRPAVEVDMIRQSELSTFPTPRIGGGAAGGSVDGGGVTP